MDKLTLDYEPIKSKRQVFKNFQFIAEEPGFARVEVGTVVLRSET